MVVDHLLDVSVVVVVPSSTCHDAPPPSRRVRANAVGNGKRNESVAQDSRNSTVACGAHVSSRALGTLCTAMSRKEFAQHIRERSSLDEMSERRTHQNPASPTLHVYAEGNGASSPCTHVVVPRRQCQIDAPESVERESWACVEFFEDAGEMGGGRFSASAWHGACPSSLSTWAGKEPLTSRCCLNSKHFACLFWLTMFSSRYASMRTVACRHLGQIPVTSIKRIVGMMAHENAPSCC